jgi:hypothetical protein
MFSNHSGLPSTPSASTIDRKQQTASLIAVEVSDAGDDWGVAMIRRCLAVVFGLSVFGSFLCLSAQTAPAQYYIPNTVPVFQMNNPQVVYYAPRSTYRYYPRRYRSRFYPRYSYNVYVVPQTTTAVRRAPTTSTRPSGVHPSQYIGNPHASQYMGNPHASQYMGDPHASQFSP